MSIDKMIDGVKVMGSAVIPVVAQSDRGESVDKLKKVILTGDLKSLTDEEKLFYYNQVCQSSGLNPLTKPFEYILLNGKLVLYAAKNCAEQLRKIHSISIEVTARVVEGVYEVTAKATDKEGRFDSSIGVVSVGGLKGDALANAMMKAETKAKRRVTLSILSLGMLDETEVESISDAKQLKHREEKPVVEDNKFLEARPIIVDIMSLIKIKKIEKVKIDDYLAKAGVESLSKLPLDKQSKLLEWLKSK